jgi:hypothetical protein
LKKAARVAPSLSIVIDAASSISVRRRLPSCLLDGFTAVVSGLVGRKDLPWGASPVSWPQDGDN